MALLLTKCMICVSWLSGSLTYETVSVE